MLTQGAEETQAAPWSKHSVRFLAALCTAGDISVPEKRPEVSRVCTSPLQSCLRVTKRYWEHGGNFIHEVEMGNEVGIGWLSGWQPGRVIISVHCNF